MIEKEKRPRNIDNKLNLFFRHQGPTPDMVRILKWLRFYEEAAKVVQRRMVPNFKKLFERAVRTAQR